MGLTKGESDSGKRSKECLRFCFKMERCLGDGEGVSFNVNSLKS